MSCIRFLSIVILAIAVGGCTAGTADPTAAQPSASAASTPSAPPSMDTTASPQSIDASPSHGGLPSGPYAWYQALVVTVDGLAVRRGPTTSAAPAFAAPWDAAAGDWVPTTNEVRLDAGYQVRVSLGPVARDGFDWYEVFQTPQPGAESEVVQWDVDNDGSYADSGWIAVAERGATFVEPASASGEAPITPLVFAAGSSGSYLSEPLQAEGVPVSGTWVLVTDDLAPCDLTVTLEPLGERLVATSLIGEFEYGVHGARDLAAGEYRLRVTAGVEGDPDAACGWSLVLFHERT